jgi:hypothetical protein
MSERSVEFNGAKNKLNMKKIAAGIAAFATLSTGAFMGESVANANPQYIARGTGQGMPGPEALPPSNERVDVGTPGKTPIVDLGFADSVRVTSENYQRAGIAGPDDSSSVGYSSSAMSLHEANTNPEFANKMDENTYIGDPCNPHGGIARDPAIALIIGRGCVGPNANPNAHETEIYSDEDPIANWHAPVSLIDAVDMAAGYNMDHGYYSEPGTYTVTRHDEGNTTYEVHHHNQSAITRYMKRTHNVDTPPEVEGFIQGSIQNGNHPAPAPAPGIPAMPVAMPVFELPAFDAPALAPLPSFEEAVAPIVEAFQQPAAMPEAAPAPVFEAPAPIEEYIAPVLEAVQEYIPEYVPEFVPEFVPEEYVPEYVPEFIPEYVPEQYVPEYIPEYVEEYVAPVQEQFNQVQEQFNDAVSQFTPPAVAIPGLPW